MKDFSQIAAEIAEIESATTASKNHCFFPVVSKKTGELVCYDYNPFAGSLSKIAFTSDLYHAINDSASNVKDFSLLAIKNLLLMLMKKRDEGEAIPLISIYTLLVPSDIPSFMQNLNDFVSDNDCSGIDLIINIPQDFLDRADLRQINTLSKFLKGMGFSLGVYLVGERYIHNNCYLPDLFRRIIVVPNFIDTALMSKNSSSYAARTLNNFMVGSEIISIPATVSDADANILYNCECTDFTHTLSPIDGFDVLFDDFKARQIKKIEKVELKPFASNLNSERFIHDFVNTSIVIVVYDAPTDKIEVSENASKVFGFDIAAEFANSSADFLKKFVYSEDVEKFMFAISSAKQTLKPEICTIRCVANEQLSEYKTYNVLIQVLINSVGQPTRFQCILIPA
jgi:hypothetical protein